MARIQVIVSDEELAYIQREASMDGRSVSRWCLRKIRQALNGEAHAQVTKAAPAPAVRETRYESEDEPEFGEPAQKPAVAKPPVHPVLQKAQVTFEELQRRVDQRNAARKEAGWCARCIRTGGSLQCTDKVCREAQEKERLEEEAAQGGEVS